MPFNSIFAWAMKKRLHQIDLFRKYPIDVQNEWFQRLIDAASETEFGKKHSFERISNYSEFKRNIPLQEYDELKPMIDRTIRGEQNLLWPTEIKWFAKSSGTTAGRSKSIPVSKEALEGCHYKGGKDLLALYNSNFPDRKLYKGKHLIVGGSAEVNHLTADSYLGDLSAIIVKNLPWWVEIRRTPKKEIALMTDWNKKMEKMALSTMNEDVYILAGVPSWTMVLANKVLELSGKSNLMEVWPNLEMFMHGGVNFEPYREEFERLIPNPDMNYVETYNASEGFFGIQDQVDSNDMLLMLDYGIFFEFIPMSKYNGLDSDEVISLKDVEIGVNYALVISTNAGLWRYIIGDTIRFTSTSPYRIKITGRTKSFMNAFGEEVIVENAELAISESCNKTNAQIKEYTACPVFMSSSGKGRHEWAIEFVQYPDDMERFVRVLDEKLRSLNSDYDAKRYMDMVLDKPIVTILRSGTFNAWLQNQEKLGGQNKIQRLSNNRELMEQILNHSKEYAKPHL
jgi:hypothetical protein